MSAPRLSGFDYASAGAYLVTVCTHLRQPLFGEVVGGAMQCNDLGMIVEDSLRWPSRTFQGYEPDTWVVMPDHLHVIVRVEITAMKPSSLTAWVGSFKSRSARRVNLARALPGRAVWQRSFHDRIIRDDHELNALREYLLTNPLRWTLKHTR